MKTYKVLLKIRVLTILFILVMCFLFSFIVLSSGSLTTEVLPAILGMIFFIFCGYVILNLKTITDDDGIKSVIDFIFFKMSQHVYWREIEKINIDYIVNPTILTRLTLHASTEVLGGFRKYHKDTMEVSSMTLFPTDLLSEILSRVPANTESHMTPEIKNSMVRRYGAEVIQKFDNIGKSAFEPISKGGVFTIKFLGNYLKVYILCLIGFALYSYFVGHKTIGLGDIPVLLITAFFLSLVYGIYWWFFGGNASS